MDAEQSLKDLENSLRDFAEFILRRKYGHSWISSLKISPERLRSWQERKSVEAKRLPGEALEDRLLYYADFYDLRTIVTKHWEDGFSEAFPEKRWVEVLLAEMERLRDPSAHSRELTDYQKHLVCGISGLIRTRIMKFRGARDDMHSFFPVIEHVTDSLGNQMANPAYATMIVAKDPVRVGDTVEIRVSSIDPQGEPLLYKFRRVNVPLLGDWVDSNSMTITFAESDIGKACDINVMVKTRRSYHAYGEFDDYVAIRYVVLPATSS
ncbi:hypothetical protein J5226_03640 [Lysobacter sp. K5869]|uniref:Swt1 family HEPN domain-containing protein n=1 Tax=Lysobacter sp. K5869 TaxID=2820808 RepID=UPI001C060DE8|nr:Swt1 family HEPN domain-containing protein [Lysobacter sp. K5869]QWP77510.1 hypothetical protein J5226_03640 [Lysobacter sp. K5869]